MDVQVQKVISADHLLEVEVEGNRSLNQYYMLLD